MSGGYFGYRDTSLKSDIFGYSDKPDNVFEDREISELVWDIIDLIQDFDWYKSGDTCKENYLESKNKFKAKWFSNKENRQKRIIDEAISDLKNELYEMIGADKKPINVESEKHGYWKYEWLSEKYCCSVCGHSEKYKCDCTDVCPNCKAIMDGNKVE